MNGTARVGEARRQRVLAAVAELGYSPNRLAQNLRRQTTKMIGVVVSDIENPHFSEAVGVFERSAFDAGYRLVLCNTDETPEKQSAYLKMLADERVGGVILSPADSSDTGLRPLLDLGIPVVAFDRAVADSSSDAVIYDNVDAARKATEHLIWLGRKRIAFVGGRVDVETGAERLAGYTAAMRGAGLTPFAVDGAFRADAAEREVTALLGLELRPEAFVVANNLMTMGALRGIRRKGLSIPGDVAIVAIDDPPWAELVDPPLTVAAQPVAKMAVTAIELLFERLEADRTEARHIILPAELRIRASDGMRARDL